MAKMSNGNGASGGFMLSSGMSSGLPPAPGDAPFLNGHAGPAMAPTQEHQTLRASAPAQQIYEGGGIFAAQTYGPAESDLEPDAPARRPSRGSDFGPNMAGGSDFAMSPDFTSSPPPMMAPSTGPPMAAPGMPDIGPPPTHGGVFGQTNDRGTLGFTLVAVAAGTLVGTYYGGGYGAVAGGLGGGALVNAYRAVQHVRAGLPESDKEAAVSGTYAVGAGAIAAVIWAKLVEPRGATPNVSKKRRGLSALDNPDDCDIRPVGP